MSGGPSAPDPQAGGGQNGGNGGGDDGERGGVPAPGGPGALPAAAAATAPAAVPRGGEPHTHLPQTYAPQTYAPHAYAPQTGQQEGFLLAFHEFFRVVRRFRWVIVATVAATLVLGLVYTLLATRSYTATVRLEIASSAAKVLQKGEVVTTEGRDFEFLRTQYELLQSRNVAERTAAALALASDPAFAPPAGQGLASRLLVLAGLRKPPPETAGDDGPDARQAAVVGQIVSRRVVSPLPGSRLVDISYTDSDPVRAQRVAAGLAEQYIASLRDKRFEATAYAKGFLEDQLRQIKARLEASEQALIDFSEKEQIIRSGPDRAMIAETNLTAANASLDKAVTERIRAEETYRQVENATDPAFPQFLSDETVATLRTRLNDLQMEYQEKGQIFRESYPEMVQLGRKIAETKKQLAQEIRIIKQSLKGAYTEALKEEEALSQRVAEMRAQVLDLQKRSIQFNILQRDAETNRSLYEDLLKRYKEVDVAGGVGASNVFVVDRAEVPTSPSSPNLRRNMMISALLGLLAGLGLAFLLDRLDNTILKADELERISGLPTLGLVPYVARGDTLQDEVKNPASRLWEAYRSLATALQFSSDQGLPHTLFFTSSQASEGKSITSYLVARHFAGLGIRVLLIDADLRRPSLHRRVGVERGAGLSNYIIGAALEEVAHETDAANLTFISAGQSLPNPAELLASPKLPALLRQVRDRFDLIVIDGPPVMGLADAALLSRAADATVFIVRAGKTGKHHIRGALKRLRAARCHMVGTVLSHYRQELDVYAYDYGYGYTAREDAGEPAPEEPKRIAGGVKALFFR